MNRFLATVAAFALSTPSIPSILPTTTVLAQARPAAEPAGAKPAAVKRPSGPESVEFETMTWPEVKQALANGRNTALFYTGGTEQRGPQNANGGHNLMAKATVNAIALKLGNAIAMPVLPYTPNSASAQLPGTIGLTNDLLAAILQRISEQAIVTGFKNVILMGDHGGGQPDVYRDVARKLDVKYAPQGIHVYYCDDVYKKAQVEFDSWLASNGYPRGEHGGISDTSEMMYLGGDQWVRSDLIHTAVQAPASSPQSSRSVAPSTARTSTNGIIGDARRSSAALGKRVFDMKVDYAVRQIQELVGTTPSARQPQQ
jgi:creatinine amidohydrolase